MEHPQFGTFLAWEGQERGKWELDPKIRDAQLLENGLLYVPVERNKIKILLRYKQEYAIIIKPITRGVTEQVFSSLKCAFRRIPAAAVHICDMLKRKRELLSSVHLYVTVEVKN